MKIIKAAKGTPQELEMLVERRIDELENGIESSFVYPEDLEDLENGEYESHVTEPINASAIVRPVGYNGWAVYLPDGHDHAEKLFECESEDECYDWINDNQKIIWEKEFKRDSVESAIGSPQELQMLVEDRIDDLENDINSSFVYPEDLEALENGEYESHVTEPINASSYADNFEIWLDENVDDDTTAEVLDYFANTLGWDVFNDNRVRNYADAVAEYIDIAREAQGEYSLADWYRETKQNYPEEIEEFEHRNSVNSSVTFTEIELEPEEEEYLYEIAERYNTSNPVSGDWNTETEHEMKTIMNEFGVDEVQAKYLMKKYLGFEDDMFACNRIETAEGVPGIDFDDDYEETFDERYKPTATAISDWLGEHDQAYEDVCDFFGCSVEEDVADYANADQLIDWISEHEWLSEDFSNYFGYEWIESCTNTANMMSGIDVPTL